MVTRAGGNLLWVAAMLRSLAEEGMLRWAGDSVEATTSELPASLSDLVVRRLRHLPRSTLELLQVTAVLGDAVSLRDVAAVARRPPAQGVGQLNHAFGAPLLHHAGAPVGFPHDLMRCGEALLPGGHRAADPVPWEVVPALRGEGKVAEASARAEVVPARQPAPEVDTPFRLALVAPLALQNRAAELITVAQASLA